MMKKNNILCVIGAVCSALFAYWFVLAGVMRHVTLSASELSPLFCGGSFHVLRLLLLCCLLAAAYLLCFTEHGKSFRGRIGKACTKDRWRVLISIATVAVLYTWLLRISVVQFMTNDDPYIMKMIAAIPEYGLSSASTSFSHILFCALISLFYRIAPNGYWYTWYHMAIIFLSLTVICRCLLAKASRKHHSLFGYLVFIILAIGVFLRTASALSFTVTPAVVGCAAISLILSLDVTESRVGRIISAVLSATLMLLSYLQRTICGDCILCFWAVAICWILFHTLFPRRPQFWKRITCLLLCAVLTLGSIYVCTNTGVEDQYATDSDYDTDEYYRSYLLDFLLPTLTDEQVEACGLSPELVKLLRCWYMMDEQLTTETFKTIAVRYWKNIDISLETATSLPGYIDDLANEIISDRSQLLIFVSLLCLILCNTALLIRHGRKQLPEFICVICTAVGAMIMMLYMTMKGRFLLRIFLLIALPAITMSAFMLFSGPTEEPSPGRRRSLSAYIILGISVTCLIVFNIWNTSTIPYSTQNIDSTSVNLQQDSLEDYLFANPDTIYISSMYESNLQAFHSDVYPSNITLWGACGTTASDDRLYSDAFFEDNIRFVADDMRMVVYLMHYLTLDYGPVQFVAEERLDGGTIIFRIDQITPGADYTGWYEQNGLTYYFVDGEPVSGAYTIEGTEYTFTEPGYAGGYGFIYDQEHDIYTTAAYSLITPE